MNVLVVEDERIAAERLCQLVTRYDDSINIVSILASVQETVGYLKKHSAPDLILLDIYLSDGLSFEIFKEVAYQRPVIFITAYNQYALDAFKLHSIDYILKPVTQEALASAFNKYKFMKAAYELPSYNRLADHWTNKEYKSRFLGKIGSSIFFIEVGDISFFEADNKIVHVVNVEGRRFIVEHTMDALEDLLNPKMFFRANRSYIVKVGCISAIKPHFGSRLRLMVSGASADTEIVIPRDRVPEFRAWAEQ